MLSSSLLFFIPGEGISGNLVILTMKKKSASTYTDEDIGIVQCFDARNKREDPIGRTLLPQTSLKKSKKQKTSFV